MEIMAADSGHMVFGNTLYINFHVVFVCRPFTSRKGMRGVLWSGNEWSVAEVRLG